MDPHPNEQNQLNQQFGAPTSPEAPNRFDDRFPILLKQASDRTQIGETDANWEEGAPPPLWCCLCGDCLCGGIVERKYPQPFGVRSLRCIQGVLFWWSGLYVGSPTPFNRQRFDGIVELYRFKVPRTGLLLPSMRIMDHLAFSNPEAKNGVPIRVYLPTNEKGEPLAPSLPVMFLFHGGGWAIMSPKDRNFDVLARRYCKQGKMIVVSVDYRRAPENPFPAAIEDAFSAVEFVSERGRTSDSRHASQPAADLVATAMRCADLQRFILCGDSAGGNIAMVMATLLRDHLDASLSPKRLPVKVAHQVLFYPLLFVSRESRSQPGTTKIVVFDTPASERPFAREFLPAATGQFMIRSYLANKPGELATKEEVREKVLQDRRLAPLLSGAEGLPPTTLISAELDWLEPDIAATYVAMASAGVKVAHRVYANQHHGFVTFDFLPEARACFDSTLRDMAHVLASPVDGRVPVDPDSPTASERRLTRGVSFTGEVPFHTNKFKLGSLVIVRGFGEGKVVKYRPIDGVYEIQLSGFGAVAYVPLESNLKELELV